MDLILKGFLRDTWQIEGAITRLDGYQDRNYLVRCSNTTQYVLKITTDPSDLGFIRSQNRVLLELAQTEAGKLLPCPLVSSGGRYIEELNTDGLQGYARLFPFLPGQFLAQASPGSTFYRELGKTFGMIDEAMSGLEDAELKSRTHEWDLSRVMELHDDIDLISDPADRRLVHYFLMKYREEVVPGYHKLPKALIHGDGNDWNIIVGEGVPAPLFRGARPFAGMTEEAFGKCGVGNGVPAFAGMTEEAFGKCGVGDGVPAFAGMTEEAFAGMTEEMHVSGVIDFGDMVLGPRVNEVAIVLAYAMMGRKDFKEIYDQVITGYKEVIRLSELELAVIPYLVAARWCQTMVMAARKEKELPGSAYHQVSVEGARQMLQRWIRTNPIEINNIEIKQELRPAEARYSYFSRAVSLSYKEPIHMTGAAMQYMYGADGRTYLDCVNNIPHVGHCHPKVVEAGQRQMARLNTNTRYLYDSLDNYAEKLLSKFPSSLSKVFFVNSGSAATDLAVRLAEAYTGQKEYLVLDYAYHGNTQAAIGLSPYKFNRKGGKGKPENVRILTTPPPLIGPPPDPLIGPPSDPLPGPPPDPLPRFRGDRLFVKEGGTPRLSFFAESIVGCAGQIVLSKAFMQQTVASVRAGGGIYVADEVQTGFGRVGHKFWGFELYDVVPDIVILGKPMGNGHPMGAVVCTEAIARSFETGMEFFSSFGGNPVSCEIGLAVLEVIEEEGLQENARVVGDFLLNELQAIACRDAYLRLSDPGGNGNPGDPGNPGGDETGPGNPGGDANMRLADPSRPGNPGGDANMRLYGQRVRVSDVRGSGLFIGIELADPATGGPATDAAGTIVNSLKERGILLSTDGPYNNVIKFKPPMCFSMENARELITALGEVL
jgi:4-aminobutyrate aminotransferase-like enzyme/Ser/Thr protein kinase RdoA (MazF antagonist)